MISEGLKKHSFVTLYFPTEKFVQDLFLEVLKRDNISINGVLLKAIARDLYARKLCSEKQYRSVEEFTFHQAKRKTQSEHRNYSLYIRKEFMWLWEKVQKNIKGKIPYRSASKYIWALFVQEFGDAQKVQSSNYFFDTEIRKAG